jgi:hypothetical protein
MLSKAVKSISSSLKRIFANPPTHPHIDNGNPCSQISLPRGIGMTQLQYHRSVHDYPCLPLSKERIRKTMGVGREVWILEKNAFNGLNIVFAEMSNCESTVLPFGMMPKTSSENHMVVFFLGVANDEATYLYLQEKLSTLKSIVYNIDELVSVVIMPRDHARDFWEHLMTEIGYSHGDQSKIPHWILPKGV